STPDAAPPKALTPKVREDLAKNASKQKEYQKVVELLAPYSNEISDDGLILLSDSYGELKDHLNQIRALKIYETRRPDRFRPRYLLGLAYTANKQLDEAVQSLRKSIEFAPKHRPSYEAILQILLDKKDYYEARTLLAQMVK